MSKNASYMRGLRWGRAIVYSKADVKLNNKAATQVGNAMSTCDRYGTNMKIKKTPSGKVLDGETRQAYRGARDGIYYALQDIRRSGRCTKKK